ncbi:mRNA export factor AltName: Full=Rae1 protein homolog; AltName: Full=mRNA-associated protein mrnp 41 [Serendipita indica DSM 11827]|nr:mRNA export factor AltName: Full=Rae1 protein homolog; AltName: Full=mRNA-associated protein mrnp 41 [Serendipita indica DSM 11827]
MSFFGSGAAASATEPKDAELVDPPSDSISSLAFSPAQQSDYLAVGSWDNNVRIYEINNQGQSQGKAAYQHDAPVLDVCWNKDGSKLFSGSVDKAAKMFDLGTGQSVQVGVHDAPIRCVRWVEAPTGGILATGSWDKTYWDLRSPNPIATVTMPERVYAMDIQYPLLVVGTAERHIPIINLNNPTTIFKASCFPNASGFAVGSIEGRVAIQYVEDKDASSNFSFKCHRQEQNGAKDQQAVYAVNAITFHQGYGTFSTAGADGTINFWDKDSKTRLKTFPKQAGPITATAFSKTGTIFAYAISYDWSKGYTGMVPTLPNKVMLHAVKDDDIKKKTKR